MGLKNRNNVVLLISLVFFLFTVFYWQQSIAAWEPDFAVLIETFNSSGASFKKMEINGWSTVDSDLVTETEVTEYFEKRAQRLFGADSMPKYYMKEYEDYYAVNAQGSIDRDTSLRMVLRVTKPGKNPGTVPGTIPGTSLGTSPGYMAFSAVTNRLQNSDILLKKVLREFGRDREFHKSIIIGGILAGKKSPSQVNDIVARMLMTSHAQNVETMENQGLVSITGYSPDVRQRLTYAQKSVNINMAVRNNNVENTTFLYVGSPLITSEY